MHTDFSHYHGVAELHGAIRDEVDRLAGARRGQDGMTVYPDPALLDPITRRLLVRSIFSLVEGVAFALKQAAVRYDRGPHLSSAEVALAREESYQVTESGEVKQRAAHIRCLSNVRFAFRLWAVANEMDDDTDYEAQGWACLKTSVKVRDRLMHPKRLDDLSVSDGEVRDALCACSWFDTQLNYALDDAIASMTGAARLRLTSGST